MAYEAHAVNNHVHLLARWDETWASYNNCYLVRDPRGAILVDCGKAEHGPELLEALSGLGCRPEEVTHLIATHGHRDHVDAAALFPGAARWIHPADRPRLSAALAPLFPHDLPDDGPVLEFDCVLLGHHTPGSAALCHRPTGTLFIGDHVSFFREAPPPDGMVSTGEALPGWLRNFLAGWAASEADREQYRLDLFLSGLRSLLRFQGATALCTGHGAVWKGDVGLLLEELLALGEGRR